MKSTNKKKIKKRLNKALSSGVLSSLIGLSFYKEDPLTKFFNGNVRIKNGHETA